MEKVLNTVLGILGMIIPQFKKATSKVGVKETKEAIVGVNEISLFLLGQFKDGFQVTDVTDVYKQITENEEFRNKVIAAYENYKKIPEEVRDIDTGEALELVAVQVKYVPRYINVFGKKEAQPLLEEPSIEVESSLIEESETTEDSCGDSCNEEGSSEE